jgi:branched-chain amino acid aminotransferase
MINIYYVDGEYLPADKAMIPVDDLAIVRGIGVFDLVRTYNGKPYFLKEHIRRLCHSARKINLAMPWTPEEIGRVVLETLDRNNLDEANARIIVTGGSSSDFITPKGKPRLLVLVTPLPKRPEWWLTKGVKAITIVVKRTFPGAKSINYLPAAMALDKARDQDAMEAIYLNDAGLALEGTTSNLFVFIKGRLVTPGSGILSGITRKAVLATAQDHYPIEIRDLHKDELMSAQEVFITGTNKGLVPVIRINDITIGDGRPGRQTMHMMSLFEKYTDETT